MSRRVTPAGSGEIEELRAYVNLHAHFGVEHLYARSVRESSPSSRMIHLEQGLDLEGELPELSAATRAREVAHTVGWETTL